MNNKLLHVLAFFLCLLPFAAWAGDPPPADSKIVKAVFLEVVTTSIDATGKTIKVKLADAEEFLTLSSGTANELIAKWKLKPNDRLGLILGACPT
ncbi:MAG: hypothetical protein WCI11_21075 [Candidatus Methylumidiphilus sp.]